MGRRSRWIAIAPVAALVAACSAAGGSGSRDASTRHGNVAHTEGVEQSVVERPTMPSAVLPIPAPGWRPRRSPTAADPLRVILVGDSVALTLSGAVGLPLEQTGRARFESLAWLGFGLTSGVPGLLEGTVRDGVGIFATWPEQFTGFVHEKDPDAVVVLIGAWDVFDRQVLGHWLRLGTPEWRAWYDYLLDDAVRILTERNAHLYWLTFPCTNTYRNERVVFVNDAYRALAARWPDRITLVDLYREVCPHDRYSPTYTTLSGQTVTVRSDDGVHFSLYAAGPALAPWFSSKILPDWGLAR